MALPCQASRSLTEVLLGTPTGSRSQLTPHSRPPGSVQTAAMGTAAVASSQRRLSYGGQDSRCQLSHICRYLESAAAGEGEGQHPSKYSGQKATGGRRARHHSGCRQGQANQGFHWCSTCSSAISCRVKGSGKEARQPMGPVLLSGRVSHCAVLLCRYSTLYPAHCSSFASVLPSAWQAYIAGNSAWLPLSRASVPSSQPGCRRKKQKVSDWDAPEATPAVGRWDATPGHQEGAGATPGKAWEATPGATPAVAGSRWDATPTGVGSTPRRNRWDETPTPGHVSALAHPHCMAPVNQGLLCEVPRRSCSDTHCP